MPVKTESTHQKTLQDVITTFSSSHVFHWLSIAVNLILLGLIITFLNPSGFISLKLIIKVQHATPSFSILQLK